MQGWTSMQTSEALALPRAAPFKIDARLARWLVVVNGLVPMALLFWDALHGALGANDVNFAIRTTGLVGLVMLLLTLSVTPLRQLTGWNTFIAIRRPLGLLTFFYVATHFAIFFVFDRDASVSSTVEEILTRTYLQLGTIALVLMTALAVTSTDRMVMRLGARRWKLLHRLVYVIAILGVTHFLLLVKSDLRAPRAFAIVLGMLLLYRVVHHYLDLRKRAMHSASRTRSDAAKPTQVAAAAKKKRNWSGELVVARIFQETHDVKTFRLVAPEGGLPFDHQPGQYLNIALTIDGKRVNRSYTIASSPSRSAHCEITVKRVPGGYASHHLHDQVREGDRLRISAPAGRFVFTGRDCQRVVLLAGGVGITPLMSVARYLTDSAWPGTIYFVVAVRTRADLIFEEELRYLERRFPNLKLRIVLSQPDPDWSGPRGHISAALLTDFVPALATSRVYICGPDPMMEAMRRLLGELGVPPDHIATEAFVSPPTATAAEGDTTAAPTAAEGDAPPTAAEGAPNMNRVPAAMAEPEPGAAIATVRFERSGSSAELFPGTTLLEAAEEAGINLPFECRSGICGQCKTRLLRGAVTMPVEDALSSSDKARGFILACQAHPRGDIAVDA